MRIHRKFHLFLLTAVLSCSILTGCSNSTPPNPSASAPAGSSASNSATSSTNSASSNSSASSDGTSSSESASSESMKKDMISVRLDKVFCDCSQYGRATHVCGRNGVWRWEYEHEEYRLHVHLTIKNTGDYPAIIGKSNFDAYWDNSKLACSGLVYSSGFGESALLPGDQMILEFTYSLSRNEYENRNKSGHTARFIVRYGSEQLTYVYATDTEVVTTLK